MGRYLSWLANGALLVLCCFLVAKTANAVFAALLVPRPAHIAAAAAPPAPATRSWQDRQSIMTRNLFDASLLEPEQSVPPEESLEATQLPLELLGTVASLDPQLSWAAVRDKETRDYVVVQLHDELKGGEAQVTRIERKRIVLSEHGAFRELVLHEDKGSPPPLPRRAATRPGRQGPRPRRPLARRPPTPPEPAGLEETIRNPSKLFSQARILPKYENGEMVGMQLNSIQPGSLFEEIGFENGDVITELNGIKLNRPEESGKLMLEFSQATEFTVTVRGANGEPETLSVTLPER